jgi:hypothetical protein
MRNLYLIKGRDQISVTHRRRFQKMSKVKNYLIIYLFTFLLLANQMCCIVFARGNTFLNTSVFWDIASKSLEYCPYLYGVIFCPPFQKTIFLHTKIPRQYKTKDSNNKNILSFFSALLLKMVTF